MLKVTVESVTLCSSEDLARSKLENEAVTSDQTSAGGLGDVSCGESRGDQMLFQDDGKWRSSC